MPVRIVQSRQNARLKELRRALSRPGRDERGLAGIEGPNLLEEALLAGLHVPTVFFAREAESLMTQFELPDGTEILLVPRDLLNDTLETETPQPVAALLEPPDWTWAHVLGTHKKTQPLILVLAGLQDPGNMGTILRSAEAFGADGVLCLPGTVSIWNSKAVRASAGSVFRLPVVSAGVEECFSHLRAAEIKVVTTEVRGAVPCHAANLEEPLALLIGNEGNGVPPEIAAESTLAVTIPCPGPVESLNAAVAASVLLYEACRQRTVARIEADERRGAHR